MHLILIKFAWVQNELALYTYNDFIYLSMPIPADNK